jgi:signal transduction histidine kinase
MVAVLLPECRWMFVRDSWSTRNRTEERRRIARELHDSAGQYLAAIGMALDAARNAAQNFPALLTRKLEEASEITKVYTTEVRTMSHLLHPPLLEELGLASAVRWYVEGFSGRSGIRAQIEMPEELGRLGNDVELVRRKPLLFWPRL